MESPALCIDLGASFTKIAVRTEKNQSTFLLRDHSLEVRKEEEENQYCFPSIAAHNLATSSWAFGWEAADYKQSEKILILQDWKSVLFHEKYLEEEYDPELDGNVDPLKIFFERHDPFFIAYACAQNFLQWLVEEQLPHLLSQVPELAKFSVADFDTRVCVPDFVIGTGAGRTVERLMWEAGFETPEYFCISEPKSSLVGILTEGRNHQNDDGEINQAAMFGDHKLLDRLKNSDDAIFFLDIGSFTTDVALANLKRFRSNQLSQSPAASFPLGVYKLDAMIQSNLPQAIASKINLNSLPATEKFHRAIYGESKLSQFENSQTISLSDGTEIPSSVVDSCIDSFADAIFANCYNFLKKHRSGNIHAVILTGGGSIPSRISDRIIKGIEKLKLPLLRAHRNISATSIPVDPIDPEMVRGASAIGGNSVLVVLEKDFDEEPSVGKTFVSAN